MILLLPSLVTTLMTETTRSSEKVLLHQNNQHHFPEEKILNLKTCLVEKVFEMGLL
jgi:hypothetical protein